MRKVAHVIGNGPSWIYYKKSNIDDFVIGCNITKVKNPNATLLSDLRLCYKIREKVVSINCPAIVNEKVYKWITEDSTGKESGIQIYSRYERPDGIEPLIMSSGHYGVLWAIDNGYDTIHVWGCDSIYIDHMHSHTDEIVPSGTKRSIEKMNKVVMRWRREWHNIVDKNPEVNIIFHGLKGEIRNDFKVEVKEKGILLLNDTSEYHYGCKKVIESYEYTTSIKTKDWNTTDKINFKNYSKVILNGEGTMHHNASAAMGFLNTLSIAQSFGCETQIHNTVWQSMSDDVANILKKCSDISVREILSQKELLKMGIKSRIVPDRSMLAEVPYEKYDHCSVYEGQYWGKEGKNKQSIYPRINIFKQEWNEIVNRLRHCDLLLTGRHHEMYAAIKAKCRFIATEGSTWKNVGLAETVGAKLPTTVEQALSGKYDSEYEKIFNYCHNIKNMV